MTQDVLPQIIAGASGVTKRYVTDADDYVWFWGWWRMSLLDIWRRQTSAATTRKHSNLSLDIDALWIGPWIYLLAY